MVTTWLLPGEYVGIVHQEGWTESTAVVASLAGAQAPGYVRLGPARYLVGAFCRHREAGGRVWFLVADMVRNGSRLAGERGIWPYLCQNRDRSGSTCNNSGAGLLVPGRVQAAVQRPPMALWQPVAPQRAGLIPVNTPDGCWHA